MEDPPDRGRGSGRPDLTLLLNASYEPLRVISWQRAMSLRARGRVEVVEVYEGALLRSAHQIQAVPAVVRLHQQVPWRDPGPRFSRRNVLLRDDFRCQYCGIEGGELTLDHVQPRRNGGPTSWDNIVTCCARCNRKKGARTPEQAGMTLARLPRRPRWAIGGPHQLGAEVRRPPVEWRMYLGSGA